MNPSNYIKRVARFTHTEQWRQITQHVIGNIVASYPKHRHLDIGCGTGVLLQMLHDRLIECETAPEMYGVDVDRQLLAAARANSGIRLAKSIQCRGSLPFQKGMFDSVSFCFALAHCDDPVGRLREAWRVGKKGCCLMVASANKAFDRAMALHNWWHGYGTDETIKWHWTMRELKALLEGNGWAVREEWHMGEPFRYLPKVDCLRAYNVVRCERKNDL